MRPTIVSVLPSIDLHPQRELVFRFVLAGIEVGRRWLADSSDQDQPLIFPEKYLHRVFPFFLEDLALAHIRGLGFECGEDRTYPAITEALETLVAQKILAEHHGSDQNPQFAAYPDPTTAQENLALLLELHGLMTDEKLAALHEALPRAIRAFFRRVSYADCVTETGYVL
ncbi:MAG: hypothetical protein JWN89_296 [Parcubacteria group bacterium]|nr:hypothetical protein [Parcubacteria group bacterium]